MRKRNSFLFFLLLLSFSAFAQSPFFAELQKLKGIVITQKQNKDFKEYYELLIDQPLDHFNPAAGNFQQRIFLGINNPAAPTVMETEGYAIGNVSKPAFIKDCNLISAEHRYFGKSAPANPDWNYLTIKQAAYDLHHIRELFGQLLKGKWMTTGISKGGQTAIAYKMYFPDDAAATIANVTPLKKSINDARLSASMKEAEKTECGKKAYAFQRFAFRHKGALLKEFDTFVQTNKYTFGTMKNEVILDYLLLEYPFAFFQNCNSCSLIPDTTATSAELLYEITAVVSPRFYSEQFRAKLEPSFYMFYHELGYYEYDTEPVKQWLSQKSYPNSIFAPQTMKIGFDPSYLSAINAFISDPKTEGIIFIYGELDPYTSLQPALSENQHCYKYIAKGGCHKSRIATLTKEQQQDVFRHLSLWLDYPVE